MFFSAVKLNLDLTLNWWLQNKRSVSFWLSLILLALPLTFFIQASIIKQAYQTPTYLGVDELNGVQQVRYLYEQTDTPLPYYLAEEKVPGYRYNVMYEKSQWLKVNLPAPTDVQASFVSGSYLELGIKPLKGHLTNLEYPSPDSNLHVAISYRFWRDQMQQKPVIGRTLTINEHTATIDAIMPENFLGFRQQDKADIIVPFAFLPKLTSSNLSSLSPDVMSYLVSNTSFSDDDMTQFSQYFSESLLMFDGEKLKLSDAFGVSFSAYKKIQARLFRLIQLFSILFVFSFIAFLSYVLNNNEARQNEVTLRQHLGARKAHIKWQFALETSLSFTLLLLFVLLLLPATGKLVTFVIPETVAFNHLSWSLVLKICAAVFVLLTALSILLFAVQAAFLGNTLGRGATASVAQKFQTFVILSIMVGLSALSLAKAVEVLQKQYAYFHIERGYNPEGLYIVHFDRPRFGDTFYTNNLPQLFLNGLDQQPEISGSALTNMPFMLGNTSYTNLYTPSMQPLGGGNNPQVLSASVSPDFFNLADIQLIKGSQLHWGSFKDVVINEQLYQSIFNGKDLAGLHLVGLTTEGEKFTLNVVGVVANVHFQSKDNKVPPLVYRITPTLTGFESLLIRSDASASNILNAVENGLQQIDTSLSNPKLLRISDLIDKQEAPQLALISLSLLVTVVLLVTTTVFSINSIQLILKKSRREIALRLNLGALPHHVASSNTLTYMAVSTPIVAIMIAITLLRWPDLYANMAQAVFVCLCFISVSLFAVLALLLKGTHSIKRNAWLSLT